MLLKAAMDQSSRDASIRRSTVQPPVLSHWPQTVPESPRPSSVMRLLARARRLSSRRPLQAGVSAVNGRPVQKHVAARGDSWQQLEQELIRSRRYGRRFVLLRVPVPRQLSPDEQALRLRTFLRSIDRAWSMGRDVYLLLPEGDRSTGEALVTRVERQAPELISPERVRVAAFPDDGLTSGALLAFVNDEPVAIPDLPRQPREGEGPRPAGVTYDLQAGSRSGRA